MTIASKNLGPAFLLVASMKVSAELPFLMAPSSDPSPSSEVPMMPMSMPEPIMPVAPTPSPDPIEITIIGDTEVTFDTPVTITTIEDLGNGATEITMTEHTLSDYFVPESSDEPESYSAPADDSFETISALDDSATASPFMPYTPPTEDTYTPPDEPFISDFFTPPTPDASVDNSHCVADISWEIPKGRADNSGLHLSEIEGYAVVFYDVDSPADSDPFIEVAAGATNTSMKIMLDRGITYNIHVVTLDVNDLDSEWSDPLEFNCDP